MKQVNMCSWTDLLMYASTIGIDWNTAHDILVDAHIPPMYERHTVDIYPGVCEDYGWTGQAAEIVNGFLAANGNVNITLTED